MLNEKKFLKKQWKIKLLKLTNKYILKLLTFLVHLYLIECCDKIPLPFKRKS